MAYDGMEELRGISWPLYFSERLSAAGQSWAGDLSDAGLDDPETRAIRMEELNRLAIAAWRAFADSGEKNLFFRYQTEHQNRIKKKNREPRRGRWGRDTGYFCLELLEYYLTVYAQGLAHYLDNREPSRLREVRNQFLVNKLNHAEELERLRHRIRHLEKITRKPWPNSRRLVAVWDTCLRVAERLAALEPRAEPAPATTP